MEAIRTHVSVLRKRISTDVRWESLQKIHLTLRFLGEVDDGDMERTADAARNAANEVGEFRLRLGDPGVFPSRKRARVFWFGVDDVSGGLHGLHKCLQDELAKLRFPAEKRRFTPHLTVARTRLNNLELAQAHLSREPDPAEFSVSRFYLVESKLEPTGAVHTDLEEFKLQ